MTSPRPLRTKAEVVKDFRTAEILDAARQVIAEVGFSESSMEQIAERAGLAKGTLYLYFRSRDSLLARAVEDGLSRLIQQARSTTQRSRGSTRKIWAFVRAGLEPSAENRALYRTLQEQTTIDAEKLHLLTETGREQLEGYLGFMARVLQRGTRSGEFRELDPHRAARLLMQLIVRTAMDRLHDANPPAIEEDVAATVDFFLHGVGAGDRP